MEQPVTVAIVANTNNRKVLKALPGEQLLHKLSDLQRQGTGAQLTSYLAGIREELHQRMEAPGMPPDELRYCAGACAALTDLIGIFHQAPQLLQLAKRTAG